MRYQISIRIASVLYNMSKRQVPEEMQEVVDVIVPYLEKHPFGKKEDKVHEAVVLKLDKNVPRERTQDTLEMLETNNEIMNINGKWRI